MVAVSSLPSTERFIRFQLEQIAVRNEHHAFEFICYRIAEKRISSNLILAAGPVSAGGDQGRDAESYHTRLPQELPGAGGFIGRASANPVVVACTVQSDRLEAKIRKDLASICREGAAPVHDVAFFSVHEIPAAKVHELQRHAREA